MAYLQFKYWHIYPVTIFEGDHILELYGLNNSDDAGFGCEIYNNTAQQLITATTLNDLNIIFSSSRANRCKCCSKYKWAIFIKWL
jgi:hypothetical protein